MKRGDIVSFLEGKGLRNVSVDEADDEKGAIIIRAANATQSKEITIRGKATKAQVQANLEDLVEALEAVDG